MTEIYLSNFCIDGNFKTADTSKGSSFFLNFKKGDLQFYQSAKLNGSNIFDQQKTFRAEKVGKYEHFQLAQW